jgi:beta-lactamase regulating signal transducer with metallopeptidase domain/tetratricopeptide (TPR) repeat protein
LIGTVGLAAALLLPVLALVPARVPVPVVSYALPHSGAAGVSLAVWAWLLGALAVSTRLAVGWLRVRRIANAAQEVRDADWIEERDALALRLSLGRSVALKESGAVPAAMTAGLLRPLLLIGHAARQWAIERRRVVLLHELAHVKRLDWLSVLVAELAVAAYWFHPLAWWIARRVRRDAERASDDLVLSAGVKPSVYAGHLLGIFRSLGSLAHPVAPALAAVRPSHFEERLRAILEPGAAHLRRPTGGARWAAAGLFAAALGVTVIEPSKPAEECASKTTCATSQASVAPAAPAAAEAIEELVPESFELAAASEESAEPDLEAESAPEEATEPDAVVYAIRPIRPATTGGFVRAANDRAKRSGSSWYHRGMQLHGDEDYAAAIEAFGKAIEAGYREDASSYNIACGYALLGKTDQAFQWLDKAEEAGFDVADYLGDDDDLHSLRSDPRWMELKTRLRAQNAPKREREARAATARWERLVAKAPQSGEPYFDMGLELLRAEHYDLAVKAYQEAIDRGYRTGTALYNQACALSLAGNHEGAFDRLSRALDAGFDQPELFRSDEDLDPLRGDPEFARLTREARELSLPSDWNGRLGFRPERSRWREAASRFQEYAQKHPEKGRAWYNLGYASLAAERPEAAAEAFRKALDLGYRRPATMYNLACAYSHLDRKDEAFDWLFKAIDAGFDETWTIRRDDDLDNLRGDPRYRKAIEIARAKNSGVEAD